MDAVTRAKWDRAAGAFDLMSSRGPEWRWAPDKREFFSAMNGKVLFLAVGTGLDIPFFGEEEPAAEHLSEAEVVEAAMELIP